MILLSVITRTDKARAFYAQHIKAFKDILCPWRPYVLCINRPAYLVLLRHSRNIQMLPTKHTVWWTLISIQRFRGDADISTRMSLAVAHRAGDTNAPCGRNHHTPGDGTCVSPAAVRPFVGPPVGSQAHPELTDLA